MGDPKKDDLEYRFNQFVTLSLPGQPLTMHMGTFQLVNDLWAEIKRLREIRELLRG